MEHSLAKQFPLEAVSVAAKKEEDKFMGPKASRLRREIGSDSGESPGSGLPSVGQCSSL